MTGSTEPFARIERDADVAVRSDDVLAQLTRELASLLGDDVTTDAVRVDVDVLDSDEPVVEGRWLDSMDFVEIVAALEVRFGVDLVELLTGDEPLTLASIAAHIVQGRTRSGA